MEQEKVEFCPECVGECTGVHSTLEYCDECGGECEGAHGSTKWTEDDHVKQIIKILESESKSILEKVLKYFEDKKVNGGK